MKNNYASQIRTQLIQANFSVHKCPQENVWLVQDGKDVVLRNKGIGNLMKKAAHTFGLDWGDV